MGLFEKRDLKDYIETWTAKLSPDYRKAWNEWLKKRDIVAKQMGLDEKQILYVTKITLMTYLGYDFKRRINLNNETLDKVVKTKGTTETLEFINGLIKSIDLLEYKCRDYYPEFKARVEKVNNTRR